MSDTRLAWDGKLYTGDEFLTWYGQDSTRLWDEAAERSATEHSVERRLCLDGVAYTKQEMIAWYGDAANKLWNEAGVSTSAAHIEASTESGAAAEVQNAAPASNATAATATEHGAASSVPKASAAEHGVSSTAVHNEDSTESGAADAIRNAAHASNASAASAAEHGASSSAVHHEASTESDAAVNATAGDPEDRDADGGDSDDHEVLQSTVLLTVEELPALRLSLQGRHKQARELLQQWAQAPEQNPST